MSNLLPLIGAGHSTSRTAWQWNFLNNGIPSSDISFNNQSLGALVTDSTGKLTYPPNNILNYSNVFTNSFWSKVNANITNSNTVNDPFGGNNASTLTATSTGGYILSSILNISNINRVANGIWIRRRSGTGTVELRTPSGGINIISVTTSWQWFTCAGILFSGTTARFSIVLGTNGDSVDIYSAVQSAVTYENYPRELDKVITGASAYYGPVVEYDIASTRKNYVRNSTHTGVVNGSPGTLGTYNTSDSVMSWMTRTITSGSINGMNYIDITITGTPDVTGSSSIFDVDQRTSALNGILGLQGDKVSYSIYLALVNGNFDTYSDIYIAMYERNAVGTILSSSTNSSLKSSLTSILSKISLSRTLTDVSVSVIDSQLRVSYTINQPINITIRIGASQIEKGTLTSSNFIPTYGSSVSIADNVLGLRIWESRTNLLKISNFSSGWGVATNNTLSLGSEVSPDGSTAYKLTGNTGLTSEYTYQQISVTSGVSYTLSIYVKPLNGNTDFRMASFTQAGNINYTLSGEGTVFAPTGIMTGGTITALYNGWYRVSATLTANATALNNIGFGKGTGLYVGDVYYLWGAQMEQAGNCSSLIPTGTDVVSTTNDIISFINKSNTVLNSNTFSIIIECYNTQGLGYLIGYNINKTPISIINSTTIQSNNGSVTLNVVDTFNFKTIYRIGYSQDNSGRSIVGNNGTLSSDINFITSTTTSYLGSYGGSTNFINGYVRKIGIYNKRISNSILKIKSNIGSSF